MENGMVSQKKESSQLRTLSHSIASQATMEMRETGKVKVVCPKCGEHPVVKLDEHRLSVRCPCGFVSDGEIYD